MSTSKSTYITRMTKREKNAASIGHVLNERMPNKVLQQLQRLLPVGIDADTKSRIMDAVVRAAGEYRFWQGGAVHNLEPQQVRDQAQSTVDVVDELLSRLRHMHWEVRALADADLYRLNQDTVTTVASRLEPELFRLRTALARTAANLNEQRLPKGRRPSAARDKALRAIFQAVCSAKVMGVEQARSLAGQLLKLAEPTVQIPSDRDELRKVMREK